LITARVASFCQAIYPEKVDAKYSRIGIRQPQNTPNWLRILSTCRKTWYGLLIRSWVMSL